MIFSGRLLEDYLHLRFEQGGHGTGKQGIRFSLFPSRENIGNFAIEISLALLDIILHFSEIYLTYSHVPCVPFLAKLFCTSFAYVMGMGNIIHNVVNVIHNVGNM